MKRTVVPAQNHLAATSLAALALIPVASWGIDSPHPCNSKGANWNQIGRDQPSVTGGDTGTFVRESFNANGFKSLYSCVGISRMNATSRWNNGQAPIAYFAMGAGTNRFEVGIQFEETTGDFRLFRRWKGNISYNQNVSFQPGDTICMTAEIAQKKHALVTVHSINGRPVEFKTGFAANVAAGRPISGAMKIARVAGIATRHRATGANGHFNSQRAHELRADGVDFTIGWADGELTYTNGKKVKIPANFKDYAYSGGSNCTLTTVWPKAAVSIKRAEKWVKIGFLFGSRR